MNFEFKGFLNKSNKSKKPTNISMQERLNEISDEN